MGSKYRIYYSTDKGNGMADVVADSLLEAVSFLGEHMPRSNYKVWVAYDTFFKQVEVTLPEGYFHYDPIKINIPGE